jgi:hypothetical protein
MAKLPTEAQRGAVMSALKAGESRDAVFQDLFWALLNSKEFTFNR